MKSLSVPIPPPCLAGFAAQPLECAFDGLPFQNCKREVRERLLENQHYQCAYCERPVDETAGSSHLDHMASQNEAPARRFDVGNLVVSCEAYDTCGHKHGGDSVPDGINPYLAPNLHLVFECASDGELHCPELPEQVSHYAFTKLNLNSPALKTLRAQVISRLRGQTIAAGINARRRMKNLSTRGVGFISLHARELGRFGFVLPQ